LAHCAYCGSYSAQVSFAPCASCGNPTNGAPPRPRASTNVTAIVIGVVVIAFVGIAVAGILAAIAIPNFMTASQRARQKRSAADIRSVGVALEAYGVDHPNAPYPEGTSVDALRPHLSQYAPKLPTVDGWGTSYRYLTLQDRRYVIISAGADKTFDVDALENYGGGSTTNFDCDLVFTNGAFFQHPDFIPQSSNRGNE